MVHYKGYVYFKDKEDFLGHTESRYGRFYYSGGYIKDMPENFPATFHFEDPWDNHCCGTWSNSDEDLLVSCLKNSMVELADAIVYIKKS